MKLNIDILNTFLITISLFLAIVFPFELFLVVYAVLGPLHYLTEINWIHNKDYFIKDRKWVYAVVLFAVIIALPSILKIELFNFGTSDVFDFIKSTLPNYTNGLIFGALVSISTSLLHQAQY